MKKEHDFSLVALAVVQQATGETAIKVPKALPAGAKANGQKGGLKGGASRMASLTPEQRTALAKTAAMKRWKKPPAITGG